MNGNAPQSDPHRDTKALNQIALTLGRPGSWDGGADYLDEIARVIASTGRPHPGASDAAALPEQLERFKAESPCPSSGRGDWHRLNVITAVLAGSPWGPDTLEYVADAVAVSGRPHPGAHAGRDYEAALDRWMSGALAADGVDKPTGNLLIKVDDIDRFDSPDEPWTAQAFWQTGDGLSDGVGVGGGATVPAALQALAHDMEAHGVLYAPTPPSVPAPGR